MTIQEQALSLTEIAGPAAAEPVGTYTWRKRLAVFGHDCLAHPLIWLTNDGAWAWRFHDYCGEVAMYGAPQSNGVRITGPGMMEAFNVLREHGYSVERFSPGLAEIKSPLQTACFNTGRNDDTGDAPRVVVRDRPSGPATADLVVGDAIAHDGKWQVIEKIERGKHEHYTYRLTFNVGTSVWCTSDATWRLKPA
jgi:hypothetical protein